MCEIQFIKRYDGNIKEEDISEFVQMLKYGSLQNNDAFGLFNGNYLIKKKGFVTTSKIDYEALKNDSFLVGHNRLATSGDEENNYNNHPFKLGDFLLVHNGIIQNSHELKNKKEIVTKIKTDSYILLELIQKYFLLSQEKERKDKITNAIQRATKKLQASLSCFLYDKVENNLYYFKNKETSFIFCVADNLLIGTTDSKKLIYTYERITKKELQIKDDIIYLVNNDKPELIELGTFKTKAKTWNDYGTGMYDYGTFAGYGYNGYGKSKHTKKEKRKILRQEIDDIFIYALAKVPSYTIENNKIIVTSDVEEVKNMFWNVANFRQDKVVIDVEELLINVEHGII